MNPAMNVGGQHEMHPDAETLSAFTEQVLNAKERDEVLAHLAVCDRCRQVVALAREAAGAEVAAGQHVAARPRAWWRSWGLALVPAAALAATAAITFDIHERGVNRTAEVAKLEQRRVNEKAAMPPQAPEQPQAQAGPPAPLTPVDAQTKPAEAKPRKSELPYEARRKPSSEPNETAAAAPPEAANRPALEREEYRGTPSEAATYGEGRKKQAEEATNERHLYAAKAATPSSPHLSEADNAANAPSASPTAASTEQVEVDAQQVELQPAPDANSGELKSLRLSGFSGAHMTRPIRLPSGLPARSIASADRRMLAIDKKGTLFFSEDSGLTWEKVKRQWTGRAILVRRETTEDVAAGAATASQTAGNTSATDSLSQSETVFELVNDQSELWLSADGRLWTAK